MAQYSEKNFNAEAFGKYVSMVPNDHVNMFMKAGIFESASEEARRLPDQAGGNYIVEPVKGRLDGEVLNYDGETDNEPTSRGTFLQGKAVLGRMKAWEEKDFSTDIAGAEFLPEAAMAGEVAEYYEQVAQSDLLAILEGIFSMTGDKNVEFVNGHTNNVGAASANALNNTITKASGDKRTAYSVAIMHSAAAADFEGLQLLEYTKYTDAQGIERPLAIGRLNGKTVLVDDQAPAKAVEGGVEYTTYILGKGAFEYEKLAVKNPFHMAYDAQRNGGVTALYTKTRTIIAPKWISFTKAAMEKLSPSIAELKNGANWEIVNNGQSGDKAKVVNHKNIPIARMITKVNN